MRLAARQVDVWLVDLSLGRAALAAAEAALTADENERARKFVFAEGARRYRAGRGQLRQILAAYLRTAPAALRFSYSAQGKPFLAEPSAALQFNITHSHEIAVVAVAEAAAVGTDVEHDARRIDVDEIAGRFFAQGEAAELNSLPAAERPRAFLRCWTRKEAILKAHGGGLGVPLDSFDVSLLPGEPPRLIRAGRELGATGWDLFDVSVPAGYVAALAVEGGGSRPCERGHWPALT
ncbi:MAG: 4'-phosphopantetheinyl transferase superfamily protein [Anaerolineales bacterium]|nr:4'-phosphopantetheinyl transferase superfamily protein [Anaerolineales bacterium]